MASPSRLSHKLLLVLALFLLAAMAWWRPAHVSAHADKKAEGAELFATRGCAHCHGPNGEGTDRGPALRDLRKKLSADRIHEQIVHGGGGMPAFGETLQPGEVEDLVSFLRAKKWTAAPAPSAAAPQQ